MLAGALIAAFGGRGRGSLLESPAHAVQAQRSARTTDVRAAARLLGISPEALRRELRAGRSLAQAAAAHGVALSALVERLLAVRRAALLRNHDLDARQRAARLAQLRAGVEASVRHRAQPGSAQGASLAAAKYLGLEIGELRARLRSGHSLAQLAASTPGRSPRGLVDVLVAVRRKALAVAVQHGAITEAQQARALASLPRRMRALVNRRAPADRAP